MVLRMPRHSFRARIFASLWAIRYIAGLVRRYHGNLREVAHHIDVEHRHMMDQAEAQAAEVSGGAYLSGGGGGGRSNERRRGRRPLGS